MDSRGYLNSAQFRSLQYGDKEAFKIVYDQYFGLVLYVVKRCGLGAEESLDIAQESFLKLYKNIDSIEAPQMIKNWLVATARHLAVDQIRRRSSEAARLIANAVDIEESQQHMISPALIQALEVDLLGDILDGYERETKDDTLTLFYKHGMSTKQIADSKNEPISTVTNRISRARKKLRDIIESHIKNLRDNLY